MTTQNVGNNPNPDARYVLNSSDGGSSYTGTLTTETITVNKAATFGSAVTFSAAITAGTGTNSLGTTNFTGAVTFPAGGGTGTINTAGVVNAQVAIGTAASSGNDVSEDTLFTYTLPATTLTGTRALVITAAGTLKADSSTKTTKMYFGTTVLTVGTGTQSGISWIGTMYVMRSGASTQIVVNSSQYGGTLAAPTVVAGADTDTSGIVIKVTGQNTGTASVNAVQGNFFQVMLEN